MSDDLKQKIKNWRVDVEYWGRSACGYCDTLEGFLHEAMDQLDQLEAKAAAFDALEEIVKTNLSVMLVKAVSSDDIFCVVSETFDKPHKDYQGRDLITAINNANLDKK